MPRQGGIWEPNSTLNTGNQVDGHCLQVLPLIHTVFLNECIKTGQKAKDVGIYQSLFKLFLPLYVSYFSLVSICMYVETVVQNL